MQMLGIILIDNTLGIKPLFKQTKIENIQTKTSVLTFPGTSYSSSSVPTPDGVVNLILARIKQETPTLSCEMKDASTKYAITDKEAYRDISQNIDLNGDGIEELLVFPIEVCRNVIRGASGNGPIYVYQKQGDTWINIGDLQGNSLKVISDKTDGYYNIETNYHMSALSGIVYSYEFKLTDTSNGIGSYQEVSKTDYDNSSNAQN